MPKDMLSEQDWNDFLHQLDVWDRRRVYKQELPLHDLVTAGDLPIVDVIKALKENGDGPINLLVGVGGITPESRRVGPVTPDNAGDKLDSILDKFQKD